MKDFVKFLVDNWQWVITAVLSVFVFIVQIFRKRPKAYTFKDYIASALSLFPYWINEAEKKFKDGAEKKAFVVSKALDYVRHRVSMTDKQEDEATLTISNLIEYILSTPQKKD